MSDFDKPENEQQAAVPVRPEPKWIPVFPPDYVPTKQAPARSVREEFDLGRALAPWSQEIEVDNATRELWGIPEPLNDGEPLPTGVFPFQEAVEQPWCVSPHGSKRTAYGLYRLCQSIGCYPPVLLERRLISEIGFNRTLQLQREKDKRRDTQGTRRRRAAKRKGRRERSNS